MFERFTERARQVVVLAQDEARQLKHNYIGTEHILLGILREEEGLGNRVLSELDITVQHVRQYLIEKVGQGDDLVTGQLPFTPRAKKILELALREALSLGHNYIGTEHILLGLMRETDGLAFHYLEGQGATADVVRNHIIRSLSKLGGRGRPFIEPKEHVRLAIQNIRTGLRQIERGLNGLEAALEEQLPIDPDQEKA